MIAKRVWVSWMPLAYGGFLVGRATGNFTPPDTTKPSASMATLQNDSKPSTGSDASAGLPA
jgi:hypothetical protein